MTVKPALTGAGRIAALAGDREPATTGQNGVIAPRLANACLEPVAQPCQSTLTGPSRTLAIWIASSTCAAR